MDLPPTSKDQEVRTGNYYLIWGGLRENLEALK